MRICFLAHAGSIHTLRWAAFFRDQGHECHILSLTIPVETLNGVTFHIIRHPFRISYQQSNWHYLLQLPTIWKLIRRIKPDILNAHFLSSYGFLGALTCPRGLPFVISLHGSDILIIPKRSRLHRWVAIFSLQRAWLITSVAKHMTDALMQYASPEKLILTQQYGIDTNDFYFQKEDHPRSKIVLSTRPMVKVSQLEILIQAAANLREYNSPLEFYLAGNGEFRNALEKKVSTLQLQQVVHFIGQIPHKQMPDLLRQIAIYISTSSSDGASISLLEAMACGAFPVVTDIPANREWIQHGHNGLLAQPGSITDLTEKIIQAWYDEPLRQRAAALNLEIIREHGDYQINMRKIEQAFQNLIQN